MSVCRLTFFQKTDDLKIDVCISALFFGSHRLQHSLQKVRRCATWAATNILLGSARKIESKNSKKYSERKVGKKKCTKTWKFGRMGSKRPTCKTCTGVGKSWKKVPNSKTAKAKCAEEMWEQKRNTNFEKCKEKGPHNLETAKKSAPTRTAPWRPVCSAKKLKCTVF